MKIVTFENFLYENIDLNVRDRTVVYHQTSYDNAMSIIKNGFNRGNSGKNGGTIYGKGVYTVYDFNSALHNDYGNTYIKCKVKNLDNILCFIPSIAQKLYKNNWEVKKQIEHKYSPDELSNINDYVLNAIYTCYDKSARGISYAYQNRLTNKFNGVLYNGQGDGLCYLSYDFNNVIPIEYSTDNGKTWHTCYNASLYKHDKYGKDKGLEPFKQGFEHIINDVFFKINGNLLYLCDANGNLYSQNGFIDIYERNNFIVCQLSKGGYFIYHPRTHKRNTAKPISKEEMNNFFINKK